MPVPFKHADFLRLIDCLSDGVYVMDADRSIVAWSRGAERITGYSAAEVVGSCCADNLLAHVDAEGRRLCLSHCPMQATMDDQRGREAEAFLLHRDGHRVPVRVRTLPMRDEHGEPYGAMQVFTELSERMVELSRLRQLEPSAFTDARTGVANRRGIEVTLRHQLRRFDEDENELPFGLIMLDLDRFAQMSSCWGRCLGDRVLQMAADTVRTNCRHGDLAGRWGDDEFLVVTGPIRRGLLYTMSERLRTLIGNSSLIHDGARLRVTASVGATLAQPGDDVRSLVNRAEQLMRRSKAEGRNRLSLAA